MDQPQYRYLDGNANQFVISMSSIEYIPVTPIESSSGAYSGGDPKQVTLTETDYKEISSLLDSALQDQPMHITDRVMGSGMIQSDGRSCILAPGSEIKGIIESWLHSRLD